MTLLPVPCIMLDIGGAMLKQNIKLHEGWRSKPYDDATGKILRTGDTLQGNITIGWGWNVSQDMPLELGDIVLDYWIAQARKDVMRVFTSAEVRRMGQIRLEAVIECMYAMGLPTFQTFEKMIRRLKGGQWSRAGAELINSLWAMRVGHRATELAHMIIHDELYGGAP